MKLNVKLILAAFLLVQIKIIAQENFYSKIVTDTIPINLENNFELSQVSIIPNSEIIKLNGKILSKNDYKISYQNSSFFLSDNLSYSLFDTLFITYKTLDIGLKKVYKRRSLIVKYDEKYRDSIKVVESESGGLNTESIFGSEVEKSGTLVRGFTVGTNKDFSLNSGLRLQLSGRLSKDIEVVAALTDENTPIQPEGNTASLEELDKVFIQIKHPFVTGTFGDYSLQKNYGEFGFVDRKLQGLLGEFNFKAQSAYAAVAGSRGKFNSINFNGVDGSQGPYQLTGINNEPDIIIIAGSEKVYLDGIEMKRGTGNDYTIEYSNAQITFTPKRLISSASRIIVDFEYTDRRYSRNFFGAGASAKLFNENLGIKFQYAREGDDQNSPIDISLSDEDKKILASAGDDRNKAVRSGVTLAQPDSLGNVRGVYQKIDTLINNEPYTYYFYNPGNANAIYNVTFSFAGEGAGDYIRETVGSFKFVGKGNGSYLPIILLPLPELKQNANIAFELKPFDKVSLNLEYAGSLWDKNRFSNIDKGNDYGYARNIFLNIDPGEVEIGNLNLGKIGLSYKDRFIQSRYTSLDRINEIEFNRNYNISSSENQDQELREIKLNLIPLKELSINSLAGFLSLGDNFKSNRFNNIIKFSDDENYQINYNLDYVDTKNLSLKSKWFRQNGDAYYLFGKFKPGFEFLAEDKKDRDILGDSLVSGSLKYYELNPYIEVIDISGFNFSAKYSFRQDFFPLNGKLQKESKSNTQFYELKYSGIKEISSTLNFTYRKKKFTPAFKSQGLLDNETILIRSQTRLKPFDAVTGDLFYEVSTQKSAKLEKVFVRVTQGTGNFKYLGDLNNNGISDENEFEPTLFDGDYIQLTIPTDELFPVIDLKTSTKWKIDFSKIFDKNNITGTIFSPLSTETLWRVEENSREEDYSKIYLLEFSNFQTDKTIRGSNYFQQDIFLFENQNDFSLRFRYSQRKGVDQFSEGFERAYNRERSLRIKFKMVEEISNQTDIINSSDNVMAPISSNRKREITSNNITTDFSYRPERNIEVGFKIKVGKSEDTFPAVPTIIDLNSQTIRINLSFAGKGRLRAEVERDELSASTLENFLPFELTQGNQIGKNYFWRLNFDYRISSNLQSTLGYDGRAQAGSKTVHSARAEVRAYF